MSEEKKTGFFKNIIGVIIEPKETLERVSEEPKIFKYLMFITIVQVLICITELPKIAEFTILKMQETQNLAQSAIPIFKKTIMISTTITMLLAPAIMILISTALIKFITMFTEETAKFKNLYFVNTLAYIPLLLGGIVGAIVIAFTEAQNLKNVSTSLTLFLSSSISETSRIYKLFSCIDFFYIWSFILMAIGTSVVCKMKLKKSLIIVFGLYVVGVIIRVMI